MSRADDLTNIRQASTGGPDFTPKDWPSAPDHRLRAQLRETGLAYHTFNGRCTTDWPSCQNSICVATRAVLSEATPSSATRSERPLDPEEPHG